MRRVALGSVGLACVAEAPEAGRVEPVSLLELAEAEDFEAWSRPPGWKHERIESRSPHGAMTDVRLSPGFTVAVEQGEALARWPAGVAAVAIGYDEDAEDPWLFSLSRKDEDGWHWQQVDDLGRVLVDGRPGACIGCHGAAQDFVFSLDLPDDG